MTDKPGIVNLLAKASHHVVLQPWVSVAAKKILKVYFDFLFPLFLRCNNNNICNCRDVGSSISLL